jgi:hypothetical protein
LPARGTAFLAALVLSRLFWPADRLAAQHTATDSLLWILPVDRVADLLSLEPGVSTTPDGNLIVRGGGIAAVSAYLDGTPVSPAGRGLATPLFGGSRAGAPGAGIGLGTTGLDSLTLESGVPSLEWGDGRTGVLRARTLDPLGGPLAPGWTVRARYGTDAPFGRAGGLGLHRFEGLATARSGKAGIVLAGTAQGQNTEMLGLEQNRSPIYVAEGLDTVVTFDQGGGNMVSVPVARFAATNGIRFPSSALGDYAVLGKLGYSLGSSALSFTAAASQRQRRLFDYPDLYNPAQLAAQRDWSRVFTLSWRGGVDRLVRGLGVEAHLSYQTDRRIHGPLASASERNTRDPALGVPVSPFDFRFDFDNFAVNDELIRNFRINAGRRSPYDLANTSQYALIDAYRNNAYGILGFSESGGPVGLLELYRESRWVATLMATAPLGGAVLLRAGGEFTRYDLDFYHSQLTSQVGSDAYLVTPRRWALFAEPRLVRGGLEVAAGFRLDHFRTNAIRPDSFPRISSMPGFDPADPAALLVADQGHTRLSPRVRAGYRFDERTTVHAGLGALAQMPDLALALQGINTDFGTNAASQPYGTDLDFERATIAELGASRRFGAATTLEAAVWTRSDRGLVRTELVSRFDPFRGVDTDLYLYRNGSSTSTTGLDLRVRQEFGPWGRAWLAYSFTHVAQVFERVSPPHTLVGVLVLTAPEEWRGAGGLLEHTSLGVIARLTAGTEYRRCPALDLGNHSITSDQFPCAGLVIGKTDRLPARKTLDLRLTRTFRAGASRLGLFVDARNALNWRNVIRVFAVTGKVTNPTERALRRSDQVASMAAEAQRNGALLPDGSLDLSFGGIPDPRAGCGSWIRQDGARSPPNCVYLIQAERRFGNGDAIFTVAEQTRAADAFYEVARGLQHFTEPGRKVRVGLEVSF